MWYSCSVAKKKERKTVWNNKKERETSMDTTSTVTQRNIKGCKQRRFAGQEGERSLLVISIFLFFF